MKLSLKTLFSRKDHTPYAPKTPSKPMPTYESMYIEHMRRKAGDHPLNHPWERRIEW